MVIALIIPLAGCNVYQNTGRKQFESVVRGHLQPGPIGLSLDCWVQSKTQNFETIKKNEKFFVQQHDENHIEVCLVTEDANAKD